jgi:probable addiction module antidote protein
MAKKTIGYKDWLGAKLADPCRAVRYLNAAIEDSPGAFLKALRKVSESYEKKKLAESAGVSRESLYRMLSESGNPTYDSLNGILGALNLKLKVEAREPDPEIKNKNVPKLSEEPPVPVSVGTGLSNSPLLSDVVSALMHKYGDIGTLTITNPYAATLAVTNPATAALLAPLATEVSSILSNPALFGVMPLSLRLEGGLSSILNLRDFDLPKGAIQTLVEATPDVYPDFVKAAQNAIAESPQAKGAEVRKEAYRGLFLVPPKEQSTEGKNSDPNISTQTPRRKLG